jgi:hypothetical protein
MRNKWMVSVVAIAALLGGVGACAPSAKPVGYAGGASLLVLGTAMMAAPMATAGGDASDPVSAGVGLVGDAAAGGAQVAFGFAAAVTGAVILIAALASPGESAAATAPTGPSPDAAKPRVSPYGPWPQPPPSRSPSAPSGSPLAGSPLAPASSGALSMRGGGALAFH